MNVYKKSFLSIIVVPLQEIIENIYRILSRPATCQSRLAGISAYTKIDPEEIVRRAANVKAERFINRMNMELGQNGNRMNGSVPRVQ